MNTIDITPIISMVIALIGLMITTVLIPWVKRRITAEKYAQIADWVKVAVLAAEQIYGAGRGGDKLAYATALLRSKGIEVDIDDITDEVRAMIEAAVRELGAAEVKTAPAPDAAAPDACADGLNIQTGTIPVIVPAE